MSGNSKQVVLDVLKSDDWMLGRDLVFFIQKDKSDTLLTQEYIRRFNTQSYLPPVNGETPPDNGYKVYMQNFILDHPRLSFDNVDITSSRASLRMTVLGGNQVGLKQVGGYWYPQRIDRIEPLVGPELRLRLELSDVPGYVADDGSLTLDLRNSDDFVLTFSDSTRIRTLGGDFFKALFRALPDEKRIWSFGRIEHGDDDLLRPESFLLRTQRNPAVGKAPLENTDEVVDGALVGLVSMVASTGGQDLPGPEYPYLIPDDSDDYSATVLLERYRVALATVVKGLPRQYFKNLELKIEREDNGDLTATAVSGELLVQDDRYIDSYEEENDRGSVHCEAHVRTVTAELPVKDLLKFRVSKDRVFMELIADQVAHVVFENYVEISATPHPWLWGKSLIGYWTCDVRLIIQGEWTTEDIQGATLKLEHFKSDVYSLGNLKKIWGAPVEDAEKTLSAKHAIWGFSVFFNAFRNNVTTKGAFLSLRAALAKDLRTDLYMRDVIEQTIKLNFGGAILSDEQHLPRDIACFGKVAPRLTTFTATPLEEMVIHGGKLQLATVPAQADVNWTVERIEGSTDETGGFHQDIKGLYLAPGATGIRGEFTRVRVTATDERTGFASSALLTVVKNALQISPLLEVCQVGDAGVNLKADCIDPGELHWRILGSQPFGTLTHKTGTANTYVPGGDLADRSFIVEEIEVRNSLTGESRNLCLVTQMIGKRPADVLVDQRDVEQGKVWLSITAGGQVGISELSVVHGPGRIASDETGKPYYQAATESPAHFCVVRAFWVPIPDFPFNFEGFIVLPLPLGEHTRAYQDLEQAALRATRR
ncbi:hypothetical protein [Pseudomonas urethralis]|uniref:hypothetical protein n=1 Tax=Pseudomonas urethralis TaxID=2740517 RepID=UPI001596AD94|nr:hypothetical protein [Pseudomonas urethralis]